ncbi:MAG: HEPN domain-containing protein [Proteobacteria bacterium]|nr:HEPN domain-containing protein [Pseudomonadota bacterium]
MKNSLSHLPQKKQHELQDIVEVILKNCTEVEMIILYGSYARGTYKEPWDLEDKSGFRQISDYDILVVTSTKEVAQDLLLWDKIYKVCQSLKKYIADPRILTHDIETLNIKLAEEQYFYSDIKKEGIILYDSKKFKLAEPRKLMPKERQKIAQDYFESWFTIRAEGFFEGYKFFSSRSLYAIAAFNLHQAAESAYKTILLVFSNYLPKEHFLEILGKQAELYCSLLENILAKQTSDEEYRFKLLDYAYIGGRYDPEYRILPSELELLAADVKKLLDLTEKICKEKIESFA